MLLAGGANAQSKPAPQAPRAGSPAEGNATVDEVIVTGVFNATSIENAPISIAAVTREEISQQAAVSAADLLKNVPGVFVNSGLGEIRNIVFSRGVSARSLEAASGYFYVSLQEDGLPVEPMTGSNYGPDYFTRSDIMLGRIEALRGGTSTVTGANAPGGIFNYISRTGKSDPGAEVQLKYGLEGDGRNPYYRTDAFTGGRIGDSNLYYAVGGFYRQSDGARNPGYALNKGGQIRGNLLWDYDNGSVLVTAKYLDDRNGFFEFLPARDYGDPKIAPGFSNTSSVLPPSSPHTFYHLKDGSADTWDGSDLVHAKSVSVGANWTHEFGGNLRFENKVRYADNRTDWNTGALVLATQLTDTDGGLGAVTGVSGISGTYTYRNRADGSVAAVVVQSGGARTVTVNNMPNQGVLAGGVIGAVAYTPEFKAHSFQDQFTVSAKLGDHSLAVGGFVSLSKLAFEFSGGGGGVMSLSPKPQLYDITLTLPTGATYQVSDPSGWSSIGRGIAIRAADGTQHQYSLFAGDNWQVTDRLSADVGLRYERIEYDINNQVNVPFSGSALTTGGRDGNPLTLYDAGAITVRTTPLVTKRDFQFWAGTASVAYRFADGLQGYVRYTKGRKAPDFGLIQSIDTVAKIATIFPTPETIQQVEFGVKYRRGGLYLQAFPFWSRLSNVADNQTFTYRSGPNVGQIYSPPPVFGQIETLGVEVSGDWDVNERLELHTALTLQDPKASGFSTYTQGPKGDSTDDVVVTIPSGRADNNPKVIVRSTAVYRPMDRVSLFATYNYLGKRAANRFNAFDLPGFSTVDAGGSFDVTERVRVQVNVTNVFDQFGVLSWAKSGSFLTALDRQALTPAAVAANPNQLFSILPTQPRAFFVTATVKF
jgi:outer membrane receptor protein involved in Fe transport